MLSSYAQMSLGYILALFWTLEKHTSSAPDMISRASDPLFTPMLPRSVLRANVIE